MKWTVAVALVGLFLWTPASGEILAPRGSPKPPSPPRESEFERVGGEDIPNAAPIPSLPFVDSGTTCGYLNDYDESCPYWGSLSPDVVYSFVPENDECVSISLCDSYYDTKVYVYEDEITPYGPYACNDDNFDCVEPPVEYTSWIQELPVAVGHTYYIVIDGYDGDCGDYELSVEEVECPEPCVVECPLGAVDEIEPNAGCNAHPPELQELLPGPDTLSVCGTCWSSPEVRDTDWYLIHLVDDPTEITVCVVAEFPVTLALSDLRLGCYPMNIYRYVWGSECELICMTEALPAGDWGVVVLPTNFVSTGWLPYTLTIVGYTPAVPVLPGSWGQVKALYR